MLYFICKGWNLKISENNITTFKALFNEAKLELHKCYQLTVTVM